LGEHEDGETEAAEEKDDADVAEKNFVTSACESWEALLSDEDG
jgi:hypothetical protein